MKEEARITINPNAECDSKKALPGEIIHQFYTCQERQMHPPNLNSTPQDKQVYFGAIKASFVVSQVISGDENKTSLSLKGMTMSGVRDAVCWLSESERRG